MRECYELLLMYNFVDPSLCPEVSTTTICSEGYEITNLISPDIERRRKGFMVYNAIKPPVEIDFQFICNIHLSHILIWPSVGSQKSCGFEVEAKVHKPNSNDRKKMQEVEFVTVGRRFFSEEPGIAFFGYNRRFKEVEVPANFIKHQLINKQNALLTVDRLKIRIFKTYNSTLPSLGRIEVWGTVSSLCSVETKETIKRLYRKSAEMNLPNLITNDMNTKSEHHDHTKCMTTAIKDTDLFIPEDFKDAVTLDIMSIPMILPSGKIVDQSTIEKHERNEANWGRPPSDPFTGIQFSHSSHPVPAVSLKARIDKFLIDNADYQELFHVPRTSGRKERSSSNHAILLSNFGFPGTSSTDSCLNYRPCNFKNSGSDFEEPSRSIANKLDVSVTKPKTFNQICDISKLENANKEEETDDISYEALLESKLSAAIKSALSQRPSFLNCDKTKKVFKASCSDCDAEDLLYVLSCKHFCCRNCLLNKRKHKTLICSVCNCNYSHSDVQRYHK